MRIVANNGLSDDGRYLTVQTSGVARFVCRIGGALLLIVGMAGCQYIQFLPFLKRQVNNGPQGQSSTRHGPAYTLGRMQRTTVDASVDWPAYNNGPGGERFSPLGQITTANVASLRPVCTASLGERATMQSGPIVEPPSLKALGLVPFQINAHYTTASIPGLQAETRDDRLAEFLELNRGIDVMALPEGTLLHVEGREIEVWGSLPVKRLRYAEEPVDLVPGTVLQPVAGSR